MKICATSARPRAARRGFTLIEIIAVLAVMILLVAALIPLLLNHLDDLARKKEQAVLQSLAVGLEKYVARTRAIPGSADLLTLVGAEIGLSANDSLTNARRSKRLVLIDPALHIGQYTNGSTVTGGLLPYTQGNSGSKPPLSPRLMIVTSVGADLPSTLASGIVGNSTFTNLWNNPPDTKPASWTWNGNGPDLRIQRINMSQWFHEVALNRVGIPVGRYAVDAGTAQEPASTPYSLWLLKGSLLNLYSHVGGSDAITGGLQATEIIDMGLSFVYDNGVWRDRLFVSYGARQLQGFDCQAAMTTFALAPDNPEASHGVTKADVIAAMEAYLAAFQAWSLDGYSNGSLKTAVTQAQADMASITADLLHRL